VRRVEMLGVGLLLAVLAAGTSVMVLGAPWFTRALSMRYSQGVEAGVPQARMLDVAENVRAFVIDGAGTLPATVDGRDAFDASAVSHLADVAGVIAAARTLTLVGAVLAAVWVAICVRRRRLEALASGLLAGAVVTIAFVVIAGLAGTADFDAFFSAFHGVLFAEGTWTFPYDSLLIQLFPEPFWVVSGASWAVLTAVLGGLMWLLSGWARRAARRMSA